MKREDIDMRTAATESAEGLRALLDLIDAGEIYASPQRVWHLRGALDALDALLDGKMMPGLSESA